jgi:hypothetical protein
MMMEHGTLIEDRNGVERQKPPSVDATGIPPLTGTNTYCFSCKKDFFTQHQLQQHTDEFHNYDVTTIATSSTTVISNIVKEDLEAKSPLEKLQSQPVSQGSEQRICHTDEQLLQNL